MVAKDTLRLDARGPADRRQKTCGPRERQILAAAFEEFAANGYAAARLDNVAKRANVAKGTIYLYFPSKGRLFQAVVRSLIRPVRENFDSYVGAFPGSARELLCELISRQYAEVVTNRKARAIIRLLVAESPKFPGLSEIYHREIIEPGVRAIRLVLEKGIASGEFRKTQVAAFPQIMAAPAILAVVWFLILGTRVHLDLDAYRAAHVEFVLSGLRQIDDSGASQAPETPRQHGGVQ